jgi:hypothetical protein
MADQNKRVRAGFDLSTHTFFSRLADALKRKVEEDTGIKLMWAGKSVMKGKISGALTGQFQSMDQDEIERVQSQAQQLMADLQNPTNLVALIESEG